MLIGVGVGTQPILISSTDPQQLVEKLGEHLRGKETEKDIRTGITRGFLELNDMVRAAAVLLGLWGVRRNGRC